MASVIDTFLVAVGLDVSAYNNGMKSAEGSLKKFGENNDAQKKRLDEQSKAMAAGFNKVKQELIGLVAVAMGAKGVKDFFANMVTGQSALGRTAANLNMSARALDAWGAAAESVGGSADGMQSSMQNILAGFKAYSLGENSPVVQALTFLKIRMTEANGEARPMGELLLDIADALKKFPPQDRIRIGRDIGLDNATLNLLSQGKEGVSALVDQMERASGVTDASVAGAQKAQASWALFNRELKGVGQTIFEALVPALGDSNDQLHNFSSWVNQNKDGIGSFFGALAATLGAVARAAGDVFGFFGKIGQALSNSSIGNKLGEVMARLFAYGGSKEANDALASSGVSGYSKTAPGAPNFAPSNNTTNTSGSLSAVEKKFGLPEGMLDRIWSMESGRGKNMVSPVGATGHFQFMPATAKEYGMSREDTFDLGKSANAAGTYLSKLLKKYGGDVNKALAAYNWGPGNVDKFGMGSMPAETQNYIKKYTQMSPGQGGGSNSIQTNIGTMNVVTKATDSAGIARDMQGAIQQQSRMSYAANGMN